MHLDKGDTHRHRIFNERVSLPEQLRAVGIMASTVPQERFQEFVAWMFPLIALDDRENMTRIWQMVMPPPVFAGAKELIKKASAATGRTHAAHHYAINRPFSLLNDGLKTWI